MATDIPAATRKFVRERDRHRCRWCGVTNQGLEIHHIVYRSQGGGHHSPEILISLCGLHHRLVHSDKRLYMPLLFELLEKPGITGLQLVRWASSRAMSRSAGGKTSISPTDVPIPPREEQD